MGDENLLFFENDAAHAVSGRWHTLAVIFTDVFMTVGTVGLTLIAVQAQVEWRTMLDDSLVQC